MADLPDLVKTEAAIIEQTNAFRRAERLGEVKLNAQLTLAARRFAKYLADTNRFAHEADGRQPAERIKEAGYKYCMVAENLALHLDSRGFTTVDLATKAVEGWKASPGHRKNLVQLAGEVNDLASRARNDRLGPDDIQGGTFSITNAGVFGAINSSPVINVPEVGILGVHKVVERAVVKNGQIVIAPMMNASIGFDHRVVDGELAVKFLRRVCELLENPALLWFHA